jgi:SAM-dependent methyltransferase
MDTQAWDAGAYAHNASFVPAFGSAVIDLLTVTPPARVLDLGCGDGVLSVQLVERGFDVRGVDASQAMVEAARQRGVAAHLMDGHALRFVDEFAAVFSNAALHWMTRPDEVLAGVHRALRPGGEFVGEFGGAGNVASVVTALNAELAQRGLVALSQWYFPSAGEYASRLERAGFHVEFIAHFDRPTPLPGDVTAWLETFGGNFLAAVPREQRSDFLASVRARLAPLQRERWVLDYVRLRFRAHKRR